MCDDNIAKTRKGEVEECHCQGSYTIHNEV